MHYLYYHGPGKGGRIGNQAERKNRNAYIRTVPSFRLIMALGLVPAYLINKIEYALIGISTVRKRASDVEILLPMRF